MSHATTGFDPRSGQGFGPDHVVEQRPERYTEADHATWKFLYERQSKLLRRRAVDEFHEGLAALGIAPHRIPDFAELNATLAAATGWRVVAVPGLVPDAVFFAHLAARRFPAGYWIRPAHELDYIEEPDVFHDVFGHAPLLMQPRYADYMQAYGEAGLRYAGSPRLQRLTRLYWYTVEFGLVRAPDLRIFGAGILSSAEEADYALESPHPRRIPFDCTRVLRTTYEIDHLQQLYFVLNGLEELPDLQAAALDLRLAQAEIEPDVAPPSALCPENEVTIAQVSRPGR